MLSPSGFSLLDLRLQCCMQIPYEVKSISLSKNEQKQVPFPSSTSQVCPHALMITHGVCTSSPLLVGIHLSRLLIQCHQQRLISCFCKFTVVLKGFP